MKKVNRTQIGSPYVIAAMDLDKDDFECVVGFEANGGFLTGSVMQPDFEMGFCRLANKRCCFACSCCCDSAKSQGKSLAEI